LQQSASQLREELGNPEIQSFINLTVNILNLYWM
jgi:hypothetical protein